jgi:hypothetical protein
MIRKNIVSGQIPLPARMRDGGGAKEAAIGMAGPSHQGQQK